MEEISRPASAQTFSKQERLTSKKTIEELFSKGSSIVYVYPFRLLMLPKPVTLTTQSILPQILISVSKRNFKKAVDRNLIKRRIREAYRRNKSQLFLAIPIEKQPACIAIIYIAKEIIPFETVEKKLILTWRRL